MPSPAAPLASILVPVLNEASAIADAVASMAAQRLDGGIEILLIDGGSTDGTREILARLAAADPRIRRLENPSGLISAALNIGLRHARGDWIARMDAHSEFPPGYLADGIARLRRGDVAWVAGPQLPVGANRTSAAVALALESRLGSGPSRRWVARGADAPEQELDSGVFCGVWARATLLAVGGWDERWVVNEDSEMAGRFAERGERLVCRASMVARYRPRGSLLALWRQYRRYGEWRCATAVRHPGTLRRSHLIAPGLVGCTLVALAPWGWLGWPARAGLALYVLTLLGVAWGALARGARPGEAALVPAVLITMHAGHGWGFLQGALRRGLPLAALARVLGLDRLAGRLAPAPGPVHAPALERRRGEVLLWPPR